MLPSESLLPGESSRHARTFMTSPCRTFSATSPPIIFSRWNPQVAWVSISLLPYRSKSAEEDKLWRWRIENEPTISPSGKRDSKIVNQSVDELQNHHDAFGCRIHYVPGSEMPMGLHSVNFLPFAQGWFLMLLGQWWWCWPHTRRPWS